ncbi:unnamed protein product [Dicrocoelium dendriticum]|nr:unnamed protein product [Dicrocoelium dendriticum]
MKVIRKLLASLRRCPSYVAALIGQLHHLFTLRHKNGFSVDLRNGLHPRLPEGMRDTAYRLRNFSGVVTRRKRSLELPAARCSTRKRLRRSDSASSQKENHVPLSARRPSISDKVRLNPLRNISPLNAVSEHSLTSTPAAKPITAFLSRLSTPKINGFRLTRSFSSREIPIIQPRRTLRSTRRSDQATPQAELRIELERVPVHNRPVLRSDTADSSACSSLESSPTEIPTMASSLLSWFSPRRFNLTGKDRAAKLKRLNTRKIEFDLQELNQSIDPESSQLSSKSLLVSNTLNLFNALLGSLNVAWLDRSRFMLLTV